MICILSQLLQLYCLQHKKFYVKRNITKSHSFIWEFYLITNKKQCTTHNACTFIRKKCFSLRNNRSYKKVSSFFTRHTHTTRALLTLWAGGGGKSHFCLTRFSYISAFSVKLNLIFVKLIFRDTKNLLNLWKTTFSEWIKLPIWEFNFMAQTTNTYSS